MMIIPHRKLRSLLGKTRGKEALQQQYEKALARAEECNEVVILMQKKEGGVLYFADDHMELRDLTFIAQCFSFEASAMAAGLKR